MPGSKRKPVKAHSQPPKSLRWTTDLILENPHFNAYYRAQCICRDDEEFEKMLKSFRTPLAAAFRVNWGTDLQEAALQSFQSKTVEIQGSDDAPKVLPWYRGQVAFQWDALARKEIRKLPELSEIKKVLVGESERGAITRQEAVSMIPPLVLQVLKDSNVLDMCAAPGSKTSQILNLTLMDMENGCSIDCPIPHEAAVVANDVNLSRARMLRHQLQRCGNPAMSVSCMDACMFPKAQRIQDLYDRVLSDVPCSGDGTLRKNVDIWTKWNPMNGMQLHERQIQILQRGLDCLAPGGILVYSTCSLNPIEDEAVVAAILTQNEARGVRLTELPALEGLTLTPGLSTWRVPNPLIFSPKIAVTDGSQNDFLASHDEWVEIHENLSEEGRPKLTAVAASMFPSFSSESVRSSMTKSARLLPHLNNSGGFFVAAFTTDVTSEPPLKKLKIETAKISEATKPEEASENAIPQQDSELFRMLELQPDDDTDLKSLIDFYGLTSGTENPSAVPRSQLIEGTARVDGSPISNDPRTKIRDLTGDFDCCPLITKVDTRSRFYLATPRLIKQARANAKRIRFLQLGIKAFEKLDEKFGRVAGNAYRPSHEATPWLVPYMRRRIVFVSYKACQLILECQVKKSSLLKLELTGDIENLDSLRRGCSNEETGECLLQPGGVVAVATGKKGLVRIPCLLSASGNLQPLVKKNLRDPIVSQNYLTLFYDSQISSSN